MNQNYRLEHLEYNHQNQKPNPYIDKYIFHNQKGIKQYLYPITNNRILFPYLFRKPDLFLSTSVFMSMHFSKCFQIDIRKCLNLGYPRCELFFLNANLIKKYVEEYEPQGVNRLILVNP